MPSKEKKSILSGLRPTGELHLGNLFGALAPIRDLQNDYHVYLMVADLHALTTIEDSNDIREKTLTTAALYIAFGIDVKRATLFVQSRIPEHSELAILLGMITPLSLVELNPVYKEMLEEHPKKRTFGLLGYPVLQSADILLYRPSGVPVGKDQAPHIELAREIARKFNQRFGDVFPEPETILSDGAKVLSLANPKKKMSKSHGPKTYIGLLDDSATVKRKISSAVTDSGSTISYDTDNRPAIASLVQLFHLITNREISQIERDFSGKGYSAFKNELARGISEFLAPFQEKYREIRKSKRMLDNILFVGEKEARSVAAKTLQEVKEKIGLY